MLSRREAAVLVLALLLHVVAFLCIDRTQAPPDGAPEAAPFEVELETPPAELPPQRIEDRAEEPRVASVPPTPAARAPAIEAAPHADEASVAPEPTPMGAPSASAFTFYPGARPGLSGEALGLTGRNRFVGAVPGQGDQGGATSLAEEGPRNEAPGVDQSIHDALDAHDHGLGLDLAGPLVAVTEELTRPSDTPMNGRAVFEVILDAAGNVLEVRVLDVSESRAAWERLAAQLGATLRSRRIALRTKGHALVAHIEVTSRWVLPSGQAAGHAVGSPYTNATPDGVVGGLHFDVSDIGARPARSVHARVLGEKSL